jgi:hypothetical protein
MTIGDSVNFIASRFGKAACDIDGSKCRQVASAPTWKNSVRLEGMVCQK